MWALFGDTPSPQYAEPQSKARFPTPPPVKFQHAINQLPLTEVHGMFIALIGLVQK
jgi:hypothetical protein